MTIGNNEVFAATTLIDPACFLRVLRGLGDYQLMSPEYLPDISTLKPIEGSGFVRPRMVVCGGRAQDQGIFWPNHLQIYHSLSDGCAGAFRILDTAPVSMCCLATQIPVS